MNTLFSLLNIICWLLAGLLFLLAIWNGARIEIGKPGDKAHITMELYSAKRLFK